MNIPMRTHPLFICCLLLIFAHAAKSQVMVTPTITQSGTEYTYDYQLDNTGSTSVIGFSLSLPATIISVNAPNGWTFNQSTVGSESLIQWGSSDIEFDLQTLSSLSGFRIISEAPSDTVSYSALDENFVDFNGLTLGPKTAAVPAPSAIFTALIGLIPAVGTFVYRRRK